MSEVVQLTSATGEARRARFLSRVTPALQTNAIYVLFTTVEETLAAVRVAAAVGDAMAVPVTVVHFHAVPYPLSLEAPAGVSPAESDSFRARLKAEGLQVRVRVFLCRQERPLLSTAFKPRSLIAIGGRRSWRPTAPERLRRRLEAAGHLVLFVDSSDQQETFGA